MSSCEQYVEDSVDEDKELNFGYIQPGHGKNGKQIDLECDKDLQDMYKVFNKKKNKILLFMKYSKQRSRFEPVAATSSGGRSSYSGEVEKIAELQEIIAKLTSKHSADYTKEQIRSWAIMIQMNSHSSYDEAPKKRFFNTGKKACASTVGVSPGKRLNMRSECIDQLDKWARLMERGVISSEEYKEIQDNIMKDIKISI